jgi:hypothetical protein
MATTSLSDTSGTIEPHVLYHIADARRRLGWGLHAMRHARRAGLNVRYVGKRAYLLGHDIIDYVKQHSESHTPTSR